MGLLLRFWAFSNAHRSNPSPQERKKICDMQAGGVLPIEAPPERGTFFGLQVYARVGILLVEVYERVGKSVIWICEMAQRAGPNR